MGLEMRNWALGIAACLLLTMGLQSPDDARLVKDFSARVENYMALHKKIDRPRQTDSPQKLADSRRQIAEKLRAARPHAKQGDIFTAEIGSYFRRQIAATLGGAEGAKVRASLRHAEPVRPIPLKVNARYPQKVPLQSTPPTLLLNLPRLPQELQYRIVGRDLVLYDVAGDLIVDFLPEAIPASQEVSKEEVLDKNNE